MTTQKTRREQEFEAFKKAWEEYPSQDNEGFVPDRGGFKCGWFAALRWSDSTPAPSEQGEEEMKFDELKAKADEYADNYFWGRPLSTDQEARNQIWIAARSGYAAALTSQESELTKLRKRVEVLEATLNRLSEDPPLDICSFVREALAESAKIAESKELDNPESFERECGGSGV